MFQYKSVREQILEERKKREALQAQLLKAQADTEYIAMMADIDLDTDEGGGEDEQV